MAGGFNQGIYRYARENEGRFCTAGMDVEQSSLSSDIIASVVKYTNRVICQFIVDWVDGETLPKHTGYNMESGMMELVPAPSYGTEIVRLKHEAWAAALEKKKQ